MSKHIAILVGTRPNFIKITQFKKEAISKGIKISLIHTGQHYDYKMAGSFFDQLDIAPDHFLEVPPGSPAMQMGNIMLRLTELLEELNPDILIVPGDVNSTLAGAITANKMGIKLAHLESGLRSNDERMPEEINRILTDRITDLFFVTEPSGLENLKKEGVPESQIHYVGNTMIDTLVAFDESIKQSDVLTQLKVEKGSYVLVTIHRPSNVDQPEELKFVCNLLEQITTKNEVVFPIHPRTIKRLKDMNLFETLNANPKLHLTEPQDYFSFQNLILHSKLVLTDSGGIQEETTFRKVPCLTLRENTERPITITEGTNKLVKFDIEEIIQHIEESSNTQGTVPKFWDGNATKRILEILA